MVDDGFVNDDVLEQHSVEHRRQEFRAAGEVPGEPQAQRGVDAPPDTADDPDWQVLHVRLRGTVHSGVALSEVVQLLELLLAFLGLGAHREGVLLLRALAHAVSAGAGGRLLSCARVAIDLARGALAAVELALVRLTDYIIIRIFDTLSILFTFYYF